MGAVLGFCFFHRLLECHNRACNYLAELRAIPLCNKADLVDKMHELQQKLYILNESGANLYKSDRGSIQKLRVLYNALDD